MIEQPADRTEFAIGISKNIFNNFEGETVITYHITIARDGKAEELLTFTKDEYKKLKNKIEEND